MRESVSVPPLATSRVLAIISCNQRADIWRVRCHDATATTHRPGRVPGVTTILAHRGCPAYVHGRCESPSMNPCCWSPLVKANRGGDPSLDRLNGKPVPLCFPPRVMCPWYRKIKTFAASAVSTRGTIIAFDNNVRRDYIGVSGRNLENVAIGPNTIAFIYSVTELRISHGRLFCVSTLHADTIVTSPGICTDSLKA